MATKRTKSKQTPEGAVAASRTGKQKTTTPTKRRATSAATREQVASKKVRVTFSQPWEKALSRDEALGIFKPFAEPDAQPTPQVRVAFSGSLPDVEDLKTKLNQFMVQVGNALNDALTLNVETYVSDEQDLVGNRRLRAKTEIMIDGDIIAVIPMRPEGIDEVLWAAHVDMVKQAQANRAELVKLAVEAVTGIVKTFTPV